MALPSDTRGARWQSATSTPLVILGLGYLLAYALPIITSHRVADLDLVCRVVGWIVWLAFAIDYVTRFALSNGRLTFFRQHLFDLATVILPVVRPLRALRAVLTVSLVSKRLARSRIATTAISAAVTAVAVWFIAGLAVTDAEFDAASANIHSIRDGWWWALTTMTTVGYGDRYPTTSQGQLIGAALMLFGIGLLGTITATIAASYTLDIETEQTRELTAEIDETTSDLDQVRQDLAAMQENLLRIQSAMSRMLEDRSAPTPDYDLPEQTSKPATNSLSQLATELTT